MTKNSPVADTAASAHATAHIVEVMNHGWLCMLLSIGERLNLHQALAGAGPLTSAEIADRTNCDQRYLEEWLWGMAAGGIVTVTNGDADAGTETIFELPDAYTAALTRAGGPEHWSRITNQITALATLEDNLVSAFAAGEGLTEANYEGHIAEVFAGESGPIFERVLLNEVLPRTGKLAQLEAGANFADLGCGTGTAALLIAQTFPNTKVLGLDQSPSAIEIARSRAAKLGLTNVEFQVLELEAGFSLPPQDLILAANVAHDLADPAAFFMRVRDSLQPEGLFYLHELSSSTDMSENIKDPHALGILTFSLYHCLPLAKRRPGIAPGGMWGRERYLAALTDAGFSEVEIMRAPSDPNNDTFFARP